MSEFIAELRATIAAVPPAPEQLHAYLERVRERAYSITDEEVAALLDAGFTEDELFEQTVAVAVAEGLRRLDAAHEVIG